MEHRKVNIRNIRDIGVRCHGAGFIITILADNKNDNRYQYDLHFDGAWWVKAIADVLWKVVKYERREFNAIVDTLKEEQY